MFCWGAAHLEPVGPCFGLAHGDPLLPWAEAQREGPEWDGKEWFTPLLCPLLAVGPLVVLLLWHKLEGLIISIEVNCISHYSKSPVRATLSTSFNSLPLWNSADSHIELIVKLTHVPSNSNPPRPPSLFSFPSPHCSPAHMGIGGCAAQVCTHGCPFFSCSTCTSSHVLNELCTLCCEPLRAASCSLTYCCNSNKWECWELGVLFLLHLLY